MIYLDEKHWIKTGIEYNDGQPMIGSVATNGFSDWATGKFLIYFIALFIPSDNRCLFLQQHLFDVVRQVRTAS